MLNSGLAMLLNFELRRFYSIGWGVMALLAVELFAIFFVVIPRYRNLKVAQMELIALRQSSTGSTERVSDYGATLDEADQFFNQLPSRASLTEMLLFLQEATDDQGLVLERGDYALIKNIDGVIARYVVTLRSSQFADFGNEKIEDDRINLFVQ